MTPTLGDIRAAADAIRGHVAVTPCLHSRTLSAITGAEVFLKFENHQFTASFKERGALNKLLSLPPELRARGVIACSAGNHAQGVAYHARRLGIAAVIVMPRHTPFVKVEHTRKHGAEVILVGDSFEDARAHALALADSRGLTWVHPYDDAMVIAGQGTIALEILDAQPDIDTLVIAIGGGGMAAGMAIAAKAVRPAIEVLGVEMLRFPSMLHALAGTQAQFGTSTIAEGIAVKEPGKLTRAVLAGLLGDIILVDEGDIEHAIVLLLEIEKTVVEGAGAASLAALLTSPERFRGRKVALVLSGGNIDPLALAEIVQRGMVRAGRLARIAVQVRDLPGSLARVTAILAEQNANIEEVHHQRAFTHLTLQDAEVDLVLKTRDHAHVAEIVVALSAAGFAARVRSVDPLAPAPA